MLLKLTQNLSDRQFRVLIYMLAKETPIDIVSCLSDIKNFHLSEEERCKRFILRLESKINIEEIEKVCETMNEDTYDTDTIRNELKLKPYQYIPKEITVKKRML